jgi:ureidoacrylate peracid hydrolase
MTETRALPPLDPDRTALLVIDMQKGACYQDGTLGRSGVDLSAAREMLPRLRKLIKTCQRAGVPVIWTRQWHYQDDAARAARVLPTYFDRREQVAFQRGSYDAELVDELADLVTDEGEIIDKHRWSCFHETRLDSLLKILGTRVLVIVGGTTNACVDTTARDAFMHEYDVVLVTDCIAGVRQDWHEAALEILGFYVGTLARAEDVQTSLAAHGAVTAVGSA